MKIKYLLPVLSTAICLSVPFSVQAADVQDMGATKRVGNVVWHKYSDIDATELANKSVPEDSTSLFFIRRSDDDPEETSANIAVNDRFQVSLQPGNYTQVYSCVGTNRISAEVTGRKINDLLQSAKSYNLAGGGTYFFYVDVDNQGQSHIQQITKKSALDVLDSKHYQSHQISRVVPDCPIIETPLIVQPLIQQPMAEATSVLREPARIELQVLFDNDKAIIKPEYFSEVATVADFMKQYANSVAVIEGHTDNHAGDDYNQQLSERRAAAIEQMLIRKYGIDANRIRSIGYGESRPIASNDTAEGRQQNRRVIAVVEERP